MISSGKPTTLILAALDSAPEGLGARTAIRSDICLVRDAICIHTHLITSSLNKCELRIIRTVSMLTTSVVHENRPIEYLVNHDHKLIIRTTETVRDEDCDVQVIPHQIPPDQGKI